MNLSYKTDNSIICEFYCIAFIECAISKKNSVKLNQFIFCLLLYKKWQENK